ncbi:MAG: IclR family transcriptional regulator [Nocardioidaceae bacterium]
MTTRNRPVGTVQRALAVLHTLAESREDLGNNEIARRTGASPSTMSRLLATLEHDRMVRRTSDSGRFQLGPRLVELGNAALGRLDLRRLARPHLLALTEETAETATLSLPDDLTTITVDFEQSPSSVRSVAQVGRPSVPHATAVGKAFLAFSNVDPVAPLTPYTERTITDPDALSAELARSRKRGWAQAVGEREDDLNAVAAPVRDPHGHLTAVLGLQGPAGRFGRPAMRAAADSLVTHAAQLGLTSGAHAPE